MKVFHSFIKEMILASRGFYFWVEILVAFIFLGVVLFLVPEEFDVRQVEYVHLDMEPTAKLAMQALFLAEDEDNVVETVDFDIDGETVTAAFYQSEDSDVYLFDSAETVITLAERDRNFGAVIGVDETGEFTYTYYMQGYETERLRNIYKVAHLTDAETLQDTFDAQQVRALEEAPSTLTDRQSVMPSFLTFNGALFGMFIIAAYIFLDKKEGVIKAYAVTASAVWQYLLSKAGVLIVVSVITSLIMVVPVMGGLVNYPLMILFLIAAAFFSSALGLLLSSFYNDINQAFGVMYFLIIVMMLPNIAYFIPSWDPWWVQIIPTYPMIQSFKETFLASPDVGYVLMWTLIFVVTGGALFALANNRFKQTLTV